MDGPALIGGVAPLDEREVRVHSIDLDSPWVNAEWVARVLSEDEVARVGRFVLEEARSRFRAVRAALRILLGAELGLAPEAVEFEVSSSGKPLVQEGNSRGVQFNVSHAGGLALIAVTLGRRVGVDIEIERTMPDAPSIVDRFFAEPERAAFRALAPNKQHASFFAVWTRKEAFAKATGRGIADSLHRFAVTVDPDQAPRLELIDWPEVDKARDWRIVDLPAPPGYSSALAVEGRDWHLCTQAWPGEMP